MTLTAILRRACLFLAVSTCLFSQVNTATLSGRVTDPTGAQVPGTQLQLHNEQTGSTFNVTTNGVGQFTFTFIPPGQYTLNVQKPGFQEQSRTGIQLTAGDTVSDDIQLKLSGSTQEVTISGEPPLVDLSSSDQHQTLGAQDVNELPLAKQDWTSILKLGAGVEKAGNGGLSLNGLPPAGFSLTVDGTNASADAELPSLGFYQGFNVINTINQDAIQEISTSKGIAPASVAGSMSGNVNIISKGGTNQFHGSLFEFNSENTYNARNQFLTSNPPSTFNQFGASLGGPILRDRLFFFSNFEIVRSRAFTAVSDDVPTPQFIASTLAVAPEYKPIFAVYPLPNQAYLPTAQTGRYIGAGSLAQDDSNVVQRIDWNLSSANMLTLRYTRSRPAKTQPRVIPVDPRVSTGHGDVYNLQFTHTANSWTAATRVGFNRLHLDRVDEGLGVGLDEVKFGFDSQGAEGFEKRGLTQSWEETIALNLGHHLIQFGGIVQRQNAGRTDLNTNQFSYSNLSDFLANIPNSIQINFPVYPDQLHTYQLGGFIQDDYRIRPNLTLNLGVRYDYFTVPKEESNHVFNRAPTALGPGFGAFLPPTQMYNAYWPNFGPRIGFSWGLGSQRKTVVRGGSGIFFNPHPIFGGPIETANPTSATVPNRITLSRSQALAQGLSYPINMPALLSILQASGTPIVNTTINPYFPNPYSMQWTVGVQHEFGFGMVGDVAYVGNRGLHLNMVRNENLPDRITGVSPAPALGQFRYYDSSDASRYNALQASLNKRLSAGVTFTAAYSYASNTAFGDADLLLNAVPQDNNNLRADHGPTPYAIRHSFTASTVYDLPFARLTGSNAKLVKTALGGWQISGVLTASTGMPMNVTNGKSSYTDSRPDVVAGVDPVLSNFSQTLQYLNPAAFLVVPLSAASGASIRPGNLGRYALPSPGVLNLDATLAKNFAVTERWKLQLRGDFFNALNHTNLGGLVTDISKSSFGQLTSATSRSVQIGARLVF